MILGSSRYKIYCRLLGKYVEARRDGMDNRSFRAQVFCRVGSILMPDGIAGYMANTHRPGWARYLVEILLRYKDAEDLLSALEDRFPRKCSEYGLRRARFWYFCQVIISIRPLAWALILTTWEAVRRMAK